MKNHEPYLELLNKIKKDLIDIIPKNIFDDNIIYDKLVLGLYKNVFSNIKLKTYNRKIEEECLNFIKLFKYRIDVEHDKITIINNNTSFLTSYNSHLVEFINNYTGINKEDIFISEVRMNRLKNYFEIDILYSKTKTENINFNNQLTISINKDNVILNKDIKCSDIVFRKLFYVKNCWKIKHARDSINNLKNCKLEFVDEYISLLKMEIY